MITKKSGNIFTSNCQAIVNTINCVGVMGAGIAYEFRLRYPDMYQKYVELCEQKQIEIGRLWLYKGEDRQVLNFPTKYDWKYPSKKEFLHKGLQKFVESYKEKNITSIAFPMLGADKGGIDPEESLSIMTQYLERCEIDVEIWGFDPRAKDDLYERFKKIFEELNDEIIKKESKIRVDILKKVRSGLYRDDINSLSGLLRIDGVGDVSLEKLFLYVMKYEKNSANLFSFMDS